MKTQNSQKMLRAMRRANSNRNREYFPSKAEATARKLRKQQSAKTTRQEERLVIEAALTGEDRLAPTDAWVGTPAHFLRA